MHKAKVRHCFYHFWRIAGPFWSSEQRWKAIVLLFTIIGLNFAGIFLLIQINIWDNLFYGALQRYEKDAILPLFGRFALIVTGMVVSETYSVYLTKLLEIRWRNWLTEKMLHRWLANHTFYLMQTMDQKLENPDQRVSEDVRDFVRYTLSLSFGLLNKTIILFYFFGLLWRFSGIFRFSLGGYTIAIPGQVAIVTVIYCLAGSLIANKLGRQLTRLNYDRERYEADFRFGLIRVRENAESIALHRGGSAEEFSLMKRFSFVVGNWLSVIRKEKQLGFLTVLFERNSGAIPIFLLLQSYFSKGIELGGYMQALSAFFKVRESLFWFVTSYIDLSHWTAVVQRLRDFNRSMDQADEKATTLKSQLTLKDLLPSDNQMVVKNLSLYLPSNQSLISDLNFTVQKGGSLLLHGPSGCGKSTLFRVLSGLWPFASGHLELPVPTQCMVVPQKPYLPIDSLRAGITYPIKPENTEFPQLEKLMDLFRLTHLKTKLDQVDNWSQILSPGEQQRISLLRVFIHKPGWLFLDEATSALDEATQKLVYQTIAKEIPNITIVSIAHRSSLNELHDARFEIANGK